MSIIGSNILAGASGSGVSAYEIEQSLRCESGDTHYLNRTPGTAGNRKTWTFSCWFKRPKVTQPIFFIAGGFSGGGGTQSDFRIRLRSDSDSIEVANSVLNSNTFTVHGSPKFRDPSAWYHLVVAMDTTQSTASDRVKIWVNGEQITDFATSDYPSLNEEPLLNTALPHRINAWDDNGSVYLPSSPYLAEMYHVDGTALDHEDFGEYDTNGVWRPIQPTISSYGTTGFYLDFSNSSSLGEDQAGSNDWTANNFTTSGTGTDVMSDTPTTNWCTLNPLITHSGTAGSYEEGNLRRKNSTNIYFAPGFSSIAVTSGKWYFECSGDTSSYVQMGFVDASQISSVSSGYAFRNPTRGWAYQSSGLIGGNNDNYIDNTAAAATTSGDVIGCAVDFDSGSAEWYVNGTQTGATLDFSSHLATGRTWHLGVAVTSEGTDVVDVNFGQRAFDISSVPSGFKALNTSNLPAPTIKDGSEYFNTKLYAGSGGSSAITGVGFQPDFTWIKGRSALEHHVLVDAVRGAPAFLHANLTYQEQSYAGKSLTSFDSDGFTVYDETTGGYAVNTPGRNYVAWNWKANGSGSSNTDGSITSTVSANPSTGFSIATYTGNGTSGATIGHGLGVAPKMLIVRRRDSADNWNVYHESTGASGGLRLNTTDAFVSGGSFWNHTAPTSTVFSLGSAAGLNANGGTFVAYCFAEVEGYSKIGSYTGNGSSDGPFIYTGFAPAMILMKSSSHTHGWIMMDRGRNTYNVADNVLLADSNAAENTNYYFIDFLSNGFKVRDAGGQNISGYSNIFAAFAENPFGGSGVSPVTAR